MSKFLPGKSGNPKGRPAGIPNKTTKLRKQIEEAVPELITGLLAAARAGDTAAAGLLLARALPPLRPVVGNVQFDVPAGAGLAEIGRALIEAVGAGRLDPAHARELLQGLGTLAGVQQVDELARRIAALEHQHEDTP